MTPDPPVGSDSAARFEYDVATETWNWSAELWGLYELDASTAAVAPSTEFLLEHMSPEDRLVMAERFRQHLRAPGPYSCVFRLVSVRGRERTVALVGERVGESRAQEAVVVRLHGYVVDLTDTLRENADEAVSNAVRSRGMIEQAKGVLMLTFGVDEAQAFSLLRGYSNRLNIKLARVAALIMARLSDPQFLREDSTSSVLEILLALEREDPAGQRPSPTDDPPAAPEPHTALGRGGVGLAETRRDPAPAGDV